MSKTNKPDYDQVSVLLILFGRFKGHSTYRIVFNGKDYKTALKIKETHKDQVDSWKLMKLNSVTLQNVSV